VSPGYFETIGTKVLEGRALNEQDTPSTRAVAVVNRFFEKRYFKDGHALGKHFSDDLKYPAAFDIVGVTEDTNYWGAASKMRAMYFLVQGQNTHNPDPRYQQFENRSEYLNAVEIRTAGEMPALETQVRRALSRINPDLALIDFHSFSSQVDSNFTQAAMIAKLTSLFGILALILASVGLYGVTSYSVERRTGEIGIRMALGATRTDMLTMVFKSAFLQVGIGLTLGLPVVIFGGRVIASQLFGVKPYDPLVLAVTTGVLGAAAFSAALIPARKAANTEPMLALRTE
jgi:ABC-type antimicrobial peptide transport system permease subunit